MITHYHSIRKWSLQKKELVQNSNLQKCCPEQWFAILSKNVAFEEKLLNMQKIMWNSTMFMPLERLQFKIYAFSGKFNFCSKRVLLSWIKICRDFTLQTQIFTQKYRSWLRFYSEFLRKNLAAEVSGLAKCLTKCYPCIIMGNWVTLVLAANEKVLIN